MSDSQSNEVHQTDATDTANNMALPPHERHDAHTRRAV